MTRMTWKCDCGCGLLHYVSMGVKRFRYMHYSAERADVRNIFRRHRPGLFGMYRVRRYKSGTIRVGCAKFPVEVVKAVRKWSQA